jgi:hypothetical protein
MFFYTDTADALTMIKSNDKKRACTAALRYLLYTLDYTGKDMDLIGVPDPNIVGRGADVFETGERTDRLFPRL